MKKSCLILVLFFVSILCLANVHAQLTHLPPVKPVYSISITSPKGGESLEGGEEYRIEWTASSNIYLIGVSYSLNGGKTWAEIEDCTKNANRYDWDVPDENTENARLKVTGYDSCTDLNVLAEDVSDAFEIETGIRFQAPPLTTIPSRPCECDSCESCSDMLEGSCETVYLAKDIRGGSSQCIHFTSDHKTFDCEGREITGGAVGQEFYYGIFAGGSDITIKNCVIKDFEVGIDIHNMEGGGVINNTLTDNYGSGLFIADSEDLSIEENNIEGSGQGVHIASSQGTKFKDNRICGSTEGDIVNNQWNPSSGQTRSGNTCDLIYNWGNDRDVTWCDTVCNAGMSRSIGSASSLQESLNGEYGTLDITNNIAVPGGLSVDASHVTINCNGHVISGDGSGVGFLMENRVNNELKDCRIEDFQTGVELRGTSHSRVLENSVQETDYGVILRSDSLPSRSNSVRDNTVLQASTYGLYLDGDSFDNTIKNNRFSADQYSIYTTADCNNDIDNSNKANTVDPIAYFHDQTGLYIDSSWGSLDFSEVIICNVRDSEFHSLDLDDGLSGVNGIIVRGSEGVTLAGPTVRTSYQGITISNSSDIRISNAYVMGAEKDCISASQSSGLEIIQGTLRECDRGVALYLTQESSVERATIESNSIAGIHLHNSDSNAITDNSIDGGGLENTKGVLLTEDSSGNTLTENTISNNSIGADFDSTSGDNYLDSNFICDNGLDVSDYGHNSGRENTCTLTGGWADEGIRSCTYCCPNIRNDIDEDGIDDSCDCNDLLLGAGETGVDCGGKCPDCVDCTWCDSKVEQLRIRGNPNSGYIDIMFVPEQDFSGNYNTFLNEVKDTVRMRFLGLKNISTKPIYEGYEDMFNFYAYKGGYGKTTGNDAYYCYDPEGPEGALCIVCSGWLPGEKEYFDWVYSCSFTCALTLGIGCGCFAYEPDHFWEHASFVDSAGILTARDIRGCSKFGPTSHYSGSYCGNRGIMIIHETGHSLFALTDEYCGDTAYSRASNSPNVWNSMGDCQSAAASEGWTDGTCTQIQDPDCSKDKYRYDTDAPTQDIMSGGCGSGADAKFKEADVRRINYVFEHWPSGGSKGVISYIVMRGDNMTHLMSRVLPNHPDLGMWVSDFTALTQSAGGEEIDTFSFSDPRTASVGGAGEEPASRVYVNRTFFTTIVSMHDNVRWLHIFNGSSGEEMVTADLGPAIWNYCEEENWEDDYCKTVDLNNNGIPDYQEGWDLDDAMEVMQEEPPKAEAPELEVEKEASVIAPPRLPERSPETGAPKPEPSGDTDLSWVLMLLVAVVIVLAIFFVLKKGTNIRKEKPKKVRVCKNCGAPLSSGDDKFCHKCGAKY